VSPKRNFGFWIDEPTKIVTFADGKKLNVRRFDDHWISAVSGDVSYELNRQNGNLTFAGSTMKGGIATTIIGSESRAPLALMGCHALSNAAIKILTVPGSKTSSPRKLRTYAAPPGEEVILPFIFWAGETGDWVTFSSSRVSSWHHSP
jgi:hypothetical protein